MRKLDFLGIITGLILLGAVSLHADDTVLFTGSVPPDALIALDLSGSMGHNPGGEQNYQATPVAHDYDPCTDSLTYATSTPAHPYKCTDSGRHYFGAPGCSEPYSDSQTGIYQENCKKLVIAKRALFRLLDDNGDGQLKKADEDSLNVRFGYMRFISCTSEDFPENYLSGCNTRQREFMFDYAGLNTLIQAEGTGGRTPLANQLKEGLKYLNDSKHDDTAAECRKKFIIMVTDGWDTLACNGSTSSEDSTGSYGYKRRRATVAAVKDAVAAGYQVFAVGFGADMPLTERNTLNWVALKGGTDSNGPHSGNPDALSYSVNPCGDFIGCTPDQINCSNAPDDPGFKELSGYAFLAQDATTLGQSLQSILKYIKEKAFSFSAPTVPATRFTDGQRAYISSFAPGKSPFWRGDLKAYALDETGKLPIDDVTKLPKDPPLWEAASILANTDPNSRSIYTFKGGNRVSFNTANISAADLGVVNDAERNSLVNHVRGFDPWDIDLDGSYGSRKDKIGDFFHSQAVIVGAPSKSFVDTGFNGPGGFYDTHKDRSKVILAGANDGMLHAFDAATGVEKWAFIPPSLLTSLKTMKERWDAYKASGSPGTHLYYVDASPRVSDVWLYGSPTAVTKSADEWKTVLIGGLRKGGKTYFALDITEPDSPGFLWEFPKSTDTITLNKMGQSWSDPYIGRIKIDVGGHLVERWVAFIGGGYRSNEDDLQGRYVFVVDIKTGDVIREFSGFSAPIAAPVLAVDSNADGYVDRFYVGDEEGRMYSGDISDRDPGNWTKQQLLQSPGDESGKHPIFYPPAVAFDDTGSAWVFFGTGNREDPTSNTKERFYAVKDNGLGTYPRTKNDLVDVTTNPATFKAVPADKYGWTIRLVDKEKVLSKPTVFNQLVYFTTFSPNESDSDVCTTGGTARLYVAEYQSGGGALGVDDLSDFEGATTDRSIVIGSGAPSAPIISINSYGQASVIIGTTESEVYSEKAFSPDKNKHILYWRETYD